MKQSNWFRIWNIIYPIGMYFVVMNVVMFVCNLVVETTDQNYIFQQMISTVVTLPIVYAFYRKDAVGVVQEKRKDVLLTVMLAVGTAAAGVVVNNLFSFTAIKEQSGTYQEISDAFYGSTLLPEIFATCILIPILEELLYRGIVYQRLREWLGIWPAVLISALIFGCMHMNLVQFVYASCLGLLLALCVQWGGLKCSIAAHMLTNLLSVLRTETHVFDFMRGGILKEGIITLLFALICLGLFLSAFFCVVRSQTKKDE
ncbi:MAG: lysostaphin resistance A-like protein [Roseburia sp.]